MKTTNRYITGNCLRLIPKLRGSIELVIADPPYSKPELINDAIAACRDRCVGASFFFMYADDIYDLDERPDQVLFWMKPPSTKNTVNKYSRFVEVICVFDLKNSPFNQDTYWFSRSGVFTDVPLKTTTHPHTKPASLIEKLVAVNSKPGDTILDPFAGSGTVGKVCKQMGRNSISIEINHAR